MLTKEGKEALRSKLMIAANNARYSVSMSSINSYDSFDSIGGKIKQYVDTSISNVIIGVINTLIDGMYTTDDFEKDIGIKP